MKTCSQTLQHLSLQKSLLQSIITHFPTGTSLIYSCNMHALCTSLHLRTELPEFLLLLPEIALQIFILPHSLCSSCCLGQKNFPATQYSKKNGEKEFSQNTTGPTLQAERTSSHQFTRWFWTEQLTESQCRREN